MKKSKLTNGTDEIIKMHGFPLKIPISYNDLKLGDIIINFEPDKRQAINRNRQINERLLILILLGELVRYIDILKECMETALHMEKYAIKRLFLNDLFLLFCWSPKLDINKWPYLFVPDSEILEVIKSRGPISLCIHATQSKIFEWLSDENIAGVKINKLRDSLMEYALGSTFRDRLLKQGRPEKDLIKKFGPECIKDMHQDFTSILKIAKKNRSHYQTKEIGEIIEKAGRDFIDLLRESAEKNPNQTDIQEKMERYKLYSKLIGVSRDAKLLDFISYCIASNEDLEIEFNNFRWEPNKLAQEIIAELLEVSAHKITSILYR